MLEVLQRRTGSKKTIVVKCLICEEFEFEAKKYSRNGVVPLARGCRADSKKKLMDVVDRLLSQPHKKLSDYKQLNRQWKSQSTSHPWIHYLTKQRVETVEMLIRLSIDVYNDSLLLIPTAFSWPGRSLVSLHSDQLISSFRENGFDQQFEEFKPPGSVLHYRDPVIYAEMLKIEGELQSTVTSNLVNAAVVWAFQEDGSLSRTMRDKFVNAGIIDKDLNMKTVFLSVDVPQARSAEGLLEIVKAIINSFGLDKSKLVGVTTDGESANIGRRNGFWKLLRTYLDRDIFSFWCVAHRSDLTVEVMEHAVPELQLWKANVLGVASYFRTRKNEKLIFLHCFLMHMNFQRILKFALLSTWLM